MKYAMLLLVALVGASCVTIRPTELSPAREAIDPDSVRVVLVGIDEVPTVGCHKMAILDADGNTNWGGDMGAITQKLRREAAKRGANVLVFMSQDTDTGFFDNKIQARAIAMYCDAEHLPKREDG